MAISQTVFIERHEAQKLLDKNIHMIRNVALFSVTACNKKKITCNANVESAGIYSLRSLQLLNGQPCHQYIYGLVLGRKDS